MSYLAFGIQLYLALDSTYQRSTNKLLRSFLVQYLHVQEGSLLPETKGTVCGHVRIKYEQRSFTYQYVLYLCSMIKLIC